MRRSKVLDNVRWLVVCKTIQSVLQLIVGMMTARYLGPSNYGLINYAKSVVAFAMPFVQLGLDATLVKEIIEHPNNEGKIMGTALLTGVMSGFAWIILVGGFVFSTHLNEPETIAVCMLYSVSMVFQAITLIQYWYHSQLQAKYPAFIQLVTYVLISALKIYLLAVEASVYWFAIAYSIEAGMIGFSLLLIYRRKGLQKLSFSFLLVKQMVSRSHPYIWAALMVTIFQNTDHVMLKMITGNEENGFYTAAITVVSVCQYVGVAMVDTMRPVIISQKTEKTGDYKESIAKLYGMIFYLCILQGIAFTLGADLIIKLLYGADYAQAAPVVRILVWYMAFSFMGLIRNVWILTEEKHSSLWKINLTGALVNVGANWLMIPIWGARGAAIASLLTQFGMNFVLGFLVPSLRENNRLIILGMNPVFLSQSIRREGDNGKK